MSPSVHDLNCTIVNLTSSESLFSLDFKTEYCKSISCVSPKLFVGRISYLSKKTQTETADTITQNITVNSLSLAGLKVIDVR